MYERINNGVNALGNQEGWAYTAGFLQSQLTQALSYVPKKYQEQLIKDFEKAVASKVES